MYLNKLFNLKDKVAAVTGAGGHLCGEMVKAYARAGCKVAILDMRLEKAQKIEKEINEEGFNDTLSLEIDVSKKSNFVSVLKNIIDKLGNIDIFINGADLKTDNLKVSSFCQSLKNNQWVNSPSKSEDNIRLENAILNKAKKLKLTSG